MSIDQHAARRLVVGIDGSPSSAAALRWALAEAARTDAGVDVIACWQWPAAARGFMPYDELDLATPTAAMAAAAVAAATGDVGGSDRVAVKTHVVEGHPARLLVEWAVGADLLVVGHRGNSALTGVLLGSVGLHCASHAPCPVVVVRGDDGAGAPDPASAV